MIDLKKPSGVTLVELVILVVVMGIIIPPLASGFTNSAKMISVRKNLQLGVTESSACAEHILGLRRKGAYADIALGSNNTICDSITYTTAFTSASLGRTVNIVTVDPAVDPTCPSATCKMVDIEIDKSGQAISSIQFMLADY